MEMTCTGCGRDCSNAYATWKGSPYHVGCIPAPRQMSKMRHCFNCGAELGAYDDYHPLDTCGAHECDRAARDAAYAERDEAHERLDRDMGWS